MSRLIKVESKEDILPQYRESPIATLLEYHNLKMPFERHDDSGLLIGMCMDKRKQLRIPEKFAFIIRTGGANMRYSEFNISYAIGVGGVRYIALIGHNDCGMVNLFSKKELFVRNLSKTTGWQKESAEDHFMHFAPLFEIGNETDFILSEVTRLRNRYPNVLIAPLLYLLENNMLYFIKEQ